MEKDADKTTYLHGIYLTDKLKCENIRETGTLCSLMYTSLFVSGSRSDYYTMPFDQLKSKADEIFTGLINSRAALLVQAALVRKGIQLKNNQSSMPMSKKEMNMILKKADIELEFERYRRDLALGIPSRLTCLYLAEDDEDLNGRLNIQNMLTQLEWRPHVFQVEIENNLGLHKADNRWYDAYFYDTKPEYIVNYWSSTPLNSVSSWEFLLEGSVRFSSQDEIEMIKSQGSFKFPASS
jgi:hypothetical protein